jgi:DNA ligase-1
MTLLARIVATSQTVARHTSRTAKVGELAACVRSLEPSETEIGVLYLSGETTQGKSGIGYAALEAASVDPPATTATLTIADVDTALTAVAQIRGAGATNLRIAALRALFAQATSLERAFVARLVLGELRQGALAGLMIDAIAAASYLPPAQVRRAAMYARHLGAVARVALSEGRAGLEQFQLEILSPIAPMLAQTAADVGEALQQLHGQVAFEWKMDGARIQVHRSGDTVHVYTRSLNDVTDSVPEVVETVRDLRSQDLILDGEVIAFTAARRPQPFQVTMRRFGRRLDIESSRAQLPLEAYFFDCLRLDGRSLADQPTRARYQRSMPSCRSNAGCRA